MTNEEMLLAIRANEVAEELNIVRAELYKKLEVKRIMGYEDSKKSCYWCIARRESAPCVILSAISKIEKCDSMEVCCKYWRDGKER